MGKGRQIRCYDYVNHPYEQVREALSKQPLDVFQAATRAAASRAESVASELRVNVGSLELGAEIKISILAITDKPRETTSPASTCLVLEWEAAESPRLFPVMKGELSLYPITSSETQLDFEGVYEPPLGVVGSAINAVVGHRIADACVHRFINDVANYLRNHLN